MDLYEELRLQEKERIVDSLATENQMLQEHKPPTEEQVRLIAIDYCKKFVLKEENCNTCPFCKQGICNFQRDKFVSLHLIAFAITEWEKIRNS